MDMFYKFSMSITSEERKLTRRGEGHVNKLSVLHG